VHTFLFVYINGTVDSCLCTVLGSIHDVATATIYKEHFGLPNYSYTVSDQGNVIFINLISFILSF